MPRDADGQLHGLAAAVLQESARLASAVHPVTLEGIRSLVRPMSSYYSNLIEGHATRPADIERALRMDLSADPAQRALQLEGRAHVEVQTLIEGKLREGGGRPCSPEFLCWIHREFYERMPDEFRTVRGARGTTSRVRPGGLRTSEVEVGRHSAPAAASLEAFLARFEEGYDFGARDPLERVIAAAAAHHRLVWIHPFLDGNGRVARLFTDAHLAAAGVEGMGIWTMSRGFARRRDAYLSALARADETRRDDLDGRGNLSDEGLRVFSLFFLETALDQIRFMTGLLALDALRERILAFAERESLVKRLPPATGALLCDCFLRGRIPRGETPRLLGMPERSARRAVGRMLADEWLVSDSPHGPLRIGFPLRAVGYYFPRLYPEGVELESQFGSARPSVTQTKAASRRSTSSP